MKKSKNKSLSKILARMAKDGDIETVAEIIEEMIEPEGTAPAEEIDEETAEAEDPTAVVETPEATVLVDEGTLADIIERLDRIIALLTPATGDEDPVEEMAEAVEEALAAAEGEEAADEDEPTAEEVQEITEVLEEILDPEVIAEGDEDDPDGQEVLCTGDALRIALKSMRPVLNKMSRKQRKRACADIAATLRQQRKKGKGTDAIAALASKRQKMAARNSAALGRKIMETRNVNYKKH